MVLVNTQAPTVEADQLYKYQGEIYRTKESKIGRIYALRLVPGVEGEKGHFVYESGVVYNLTSDMLLTQEQAKEFGRRFGICCRCGRTLTTEDSINRMMGPICAEKLGW